MNTHKVVIEKVNSKRGLKACELLGKGVGKPSEPAHLHPDSKVLPFNQAGGDVPSDGVSRDGDNVDTDDTARRITMLALRNVFG